MPTKNQPGPERRRRPIALQYASPGARGQGPIPVWLVLLAGTLIFCCVVGYYARQSWPVVFSMFIFDALPSVGWFFAAALLGATALRLFRLPITGILRIVAATALGLGIFSLLILGLGLAGWLNRPTTLALPIVAVLAAMPRLLKWVRLHKDASPGAYFQPSAGWHVLWLITMPFLAIAAIGATVPPMFLWKPGDPHPYDVLEYHLQVPREWYELGRIVPLHHNVFSYFPFNVEMHFLAAMEIRGGPWAGMYTAQFMHLGFVLLSVLAIDGVGRMLKPTGPAPILAAVTAATVPWFPMLAAVCYIEGGMLLWGTLAVGFALCAFPSSPGTPGEGSGSGDCPRPDRGGGLEDGCPTDKGSPRAVSLAVSRQPNTSSPQEPTPTPTLPRSTRGGGKNCSPRLRALLLAGLFAGFACGAKSTAVPMVLLAIPLAIFLSHLPRRQNLSAVARGCALFLLAGLFAFSPWLIRNEIWARNPIFPLAMRTLGQAHFTDIQVARFERAHSPRPDQATLAAHLHALWQQNFASWQYGYIIWPLAALAAVFAIRRRKMLALVLLMLMTIIIWTGFTHLEPRFFIFAVPLAALMIAMLDAKRWIIAASALVAVFAATAWLGYNPISNGFQRIYAPGVENLSAQLEVATDVGLSGRDAHDFLPYLLGENYKPAMPVVLDGDAQAFIYAVPSKNLTYRTVFDYPGEIPKPDSVDPMIELTGGRLILHSNDELIRLRTTYDQQPN